MSGLTRKQKLRAGNKADEIFTELETPDNPQVSKDDASTKLEEWLSSDEQKDLRDAHIRELAEKIVDNRVNARKFNSQYNLDLGDYDAAREALIPLGDGSFIRLAVAKLDHCRKCLLHSETNMRNVQDAHWKLADIMRPIIEEQEKDRELNVDGVMKGKGWKPKD
jgi:hypothetical protein